ncbi:ras-interacting protein RIP3-like [Ptychodera flava]|uniref:ras-interacting protein RIP3-like n=1 Tax=Ptychodera flava TaxID=63121 RepID=UPI00396A8D66
MSIFQESHNVPIQGLGVAMQHEVPSEDATISISLHALSPDFVDEHQETCPHRLAQRCVCSRQSSLQYLQPPKNRHHQPPQCAICLQQQQQQQQHIMPRQQQLLHLQQGMTSQQPKTFQQQHHQGLQQRPAKYTNSTIASPNTTRVASNADKTKRTKRRRPITASAPTAVATAASTTIGIPEPPAKMQSRSTTSHQSRQHDNIVVEAQWWSGICDAAAEVAAPMQKEWPAEKSGQGRYVIKQSAEMLMNVLRSNGVLSAGGKKGSDALGDIA